MRTSYILRRIVQILPLVLGVIVVNFVLVHVTPGDPDTSYMFHKIAGTQVEAGGGGSKMPLGDMLTPEQIATISAWIVDGVD